MNEYIRGIFIILVYFTTAFYLVCNRNPKCLPCPPTVYSATRVIFLKHKFA